MQQAGAADGVDANTVLVENPETRLVTFSRLLRDRFVL